MLSRARALSLACLRTSFKSHLLRADEPSNNVPRRHPSAKIDPTSLVDPTASLDEGASIGPMCVVGPGVVLGSNVRLLSHVVVGSNTVMGDGGVVHPFACIGGDPQDLKYRGGDSWLVLGGACTVREHSTINRGTEDGGGITCVGSRCLIMSSAHVGHDCQLGDSVVVSTGASLAGHCIVEEGAILGGMVGVRQKLRIGAYSMVGGKSGVHGDVLPFSLVAGNPAMTQGLNLVGLRRAGVKRREIEALSHALELVLKGGQRGGRTVADRARELLGTGVGGEGERWHRLLQFVLEQDSRGVVGLCPWGGGAG